MATKIGDILARLGFAVPTEPLPEPAPLPVTPTCESWCGGRGARNRGAAHRPETTTLTPYLEVMRSVHAAYEYCSCPAGDAARERHGAAMAALEAAATQRQAASILDAAELPAKLRRYGLDDYPQIAPLVEKIRRWQAVARTGRNLLLYGDIGTYKTSLAAAVLREHLDAGGSGLFLPVGDFLGRVRASYGPEGNGDDAAASEWTLIRTAAAPGLLLLDDVPADLSDWARGILFRLLNLRDLHERPTILTTNLDLAQLEAALGKRTFDRFRGGACDPSTGEQAMYRLRGASRRGLRAVEQAGHGA